MRAQKLLLLALLLCMTAASVQGQHPPGNFICINEIKTAGEKGYLDEFVELFNASDSLFNMAGYALLYFDRRGLALPESLTLLPDGRSYRVLYLFADSLVIKPLHYFLLAGRHYGDAVKPDVWMKDNIFSYGQLMLANVSNGDTLDAVAWGRIDSLLTNEGLPALYLEPGGGPPVSPFLEPDSNWSLQRNPEGEDTNNNRNDFTMRKFATPMNTMDSLKLVLDKSIKARYLTDDLLSIEWTTHALTRGLHFSLQYSSAGLEEDWHTYPIQGSLQPENREDGYYFRTQFIPTGEEEIAWIRVKESDSFGRDRLSKAVSIGSGTTASAPGEVPVQFRLGANYPNPFNPGTTIPYSISADHEIMLSVVDIAGRQVKHLFSGSRSKGEYTAVWDGTDDSGVLLPGGLYLCILRVPQSGSQAQKLLLLR